MKKTVLKQGFKNFPKSLKDCPNWNLANKDKLSINLKFIQFNESIKDQPTEEKLHQIYDYIIKNEITIKDKKRNIIDISDYDLFISNTTDGLNISKQPTEEIYLKNLYKAISDKVTIADSTNIKTFTTYMHVFDFLKSENPLLDKYNIKLDGISFCLTDTPFFCIDIDRDKKFNEITDFTYYYVNKIKSYTEISQSGCGVHILGFGDKLINKSKYKDLDIEIYDTDRQIVLTGNLLQLPNGAFFSAIEDRQEELTLLENELNINNELILPTNEEEKMNNSSFNEINNYLSTIENTSDKDILKELRKNLKITVEDQNIITTLRNNDFDGLFSKVYLKGFLRDINPDTNKVEFKINDGDDSSTDIWICNRIATYTKDAKQILRIWINSLHVDKRPDVNKLNRNKYLIDTVENAIKYTTLKEKKKGKFTPSEERKNVIGDLPFECNPLSFANYLGKEITDLLYLPDYKEKGYFVFNGKIWQNMTTNQVLKWIGDYIHENIYYNSTEFEKFNKTLKTPDGLKRVLTFLQAIVTKNECDIFNKEKFLLCVNNGVIDLRNGQLLKHNKDYYFSNMINIDYDPELDLSDFKFYDALYNIFENAEDVEDTEKTLNCVQKILGYALTGDISKHKIFVMVGKGRNGKSFLQNILLNILGNFGITGQVNTILLDRFGNNSKSHLIIDLKDKRTVFFNEFNNNQTFDIGRLKNISGGDILTGDAKFTNTVNFTPTCKIFLTSNYIPCFDSNDSAFIRRLIVIPFNNIFSENEEDINKGAKKLIPNLDSILLEEEKDKIFNWMVKGAIELYKDGDFDFSDLIKKKTNEIILEFNPLGDFLTLFNPVGMTDRKHIWQLYRQFINEEDQNYKRQKDLIDALCNSNWNITKPNSHYLKGISINLNNDWIKSRLVFNNDGKLKLNNGNLQFSSSYYMDNIEEE